MEGDARYGSKTMPIAWGHSCYKSLCRGMDDRFISATGSYTGIYHPVSLVVADTLLYHFNYSAVGVYFLKLFRAMTPAQFHYLSNITKTVMLTGIYQWVFYFYL